MSCSKLASLLPAAGKFPVPIGGSTLSQFNQLPPCPALAFHVPPVLENSLEVRRVNPPPPFKVFFIQPVQNQQEGNFIPAAWPHRVRQTGDVCRAGWKHSLHGGSILQDGPAQEEWGMHPCSLQPGGLFGWIQQITTSEF